MSMKPRPSSIKTLRHQLSRPLKDPKGDHLRAKIAAVPPDEDQLRWLPLNEAPKDVTDLVSHVPSPNLGTHVIKVMTLNEREILLLHFNNETRQFDKFFIVPNPDGSPV